MSREDVLLSCLACGAVNRLPANRPAEAGRCGKCKADLFPKEPLVLTGKVLFHAVESDRVPLLVDCWAPWCGPCRSFAPTFARAAEQLHPRVRLGKLNTEEEQAAAARLGIRSIPTLILFGQGQEVARMSGALPLPNLLRWVSETVGM
ncbi:MAG: thioredoxin TrxC [Rhodospirillum sp.]|nr:thioredoxin TrxC [Rhodospirillum sp.]MCF8490636.1 thioredoxin TrxC [Rhodospirillum sp.]MCF8500734.1 thioredoxin TrxC [Rhodospirillum sp.]